MARIKASVSHLENHVEDIYKIAYQNKLKFRKKRLTVRINPCNARLVVKDELERLAQKANDRPVFACDSAIWFLDSDIASDQICVSDSENRSIVINLTK